VIKNNWLFLHNGGQKQFDYLLGKEKVSVESVQNFALNIRDRIYYFNTKKIEFRHVVFPSKPLVKSIFLPENFENVSSLFESYYKNHLTAVVSYVLYPLKNLKYCESEFSTFHKYNTHNSDFGYLEISKSLLQSLGQNFYFEKYFKNIVTHEIGGDLITMLGSFDKNPEQFINLLLMNFYSVTNRKFLPGNKDDVQIIHNFEAPTTKRLLIFGDSFFKGMLKFLKIYFSEILYIRSSFIHKDIVENYKPDVVFTGGAERYMCNVESDKNANNFLMALYGHSEYMPSIAYREALEACLSYAHYPHTYEIWLQKIASNKYQNKIKISPSFEDADILRDVALYFENNGDIATAYKLMKEAIGKRPNGPAIKSKVEEYKKWIEL
jgi:hypothetical protein